MALLMNKKQVKRYPQRFWAMYYHYSPQLSAQYLLRVVAHGEPTDRPAKDYSVTYSRYLLIIDNSPIHKMTKLADNEVQTMHFEDWSYDKAEDRLVRLTRRTLRALRLKWAAAKL